MGLLGKVFGAFLWRDRVKVQDDLIRKMDERDSRTQKRRSNQQRIRKSASKDELKRQMGQGPGVRLCVNVNEAVAEGRRAARDGNYKEALYYCDEALRLGPQHAKLWTNKGATLIMLDRPDEALKQFDRALEIKPHSHEAWCNKGSALLKLNRNEDALQCFERALEIKPKYGRAWYNKGIVLQRKEQLKEANECFTKAFKFDGSLRKLEREQALTSSR